MSRFRRPRRAARRWLRWGLSAVGVLAVLWGAGLFWFVGQVPREVPADGAATDAIVVLTGGSGRLDEGDFTLDVGQIKVVYAFTPDLILSSNVQYDSESRAVGANTRFRWTPRPGTDLFSLPIVT